MANPAKEALDKLKSDLLKGIATDRTAVDALVVNTNGRSPADLQKEVEAALMKGEVSERSGVDNLVYQSS